MRILVLITACAIAGCASAPPPRTVPAVPAAPAANLAPAPGITSAPAEATPKVSKEGQFKPPAGYKTKLVGQNLYYCKKTVVLGSRFPKEICMNEAELKEHLASTDEMRRDKDEVSRICTSATGCAWN